MLIYELEVETTCLFIHEGPAHRGVRINLVEVYPSQETYDCVSYRMSSQLHPETTSVLYL